MASPRFVRLIDRTKQIRISPKVAIMFCFFVNFYPFGRKSSSMVFLQGRRVIGVEKNITIWIPKRDSILDELPSG